VLLSFTKLGWATLESSILAMHEICRGYSTLLPAVIEISDSALGQKNVDASVSDPLGIFNLLIAQASVHINRHIRESAFDFIRILCSQKSRRIGDPDSVHGAAYTVSGTVCPVSEYPSHCVTDNTSFSRSLFTCIVTALSKGMEDNWCQIRRAAVHAAKTFLLSDLYYRVSLPTGTSSLNSITPVCTLSSTGKGSGEGMGIKMEGAQPEDCWNKLLPGLCMNRFYVADGVNTIAREIWHEIINKNGNGRKMVMEYLTEIIDHYIAMSQASNHMVSEAALLALSELLLRMPRESLLLHIPRITRNILECVHSDSWPVRDSATISSGSLVKCYPEETAEYLNVFLDSWTISVSSAIWSVRDNSSSAFGDALSSTNTEVRTLVLEKILGHLNTNLMAAKKELAIGEKVAQFISPDMLKFMAENEKRILKMAIEQQENKLEHKFLNESSINGEEYSKGIRLGGKGLGSWGCCLDCMDPRSGSPWEVSDGCIYLIKDLCSSHPDEALRFLPKVYDLLFLEHYKSSNKLQTTILTQVITSSQLLIILPPSSSVGPFLDLIGAVNRSF
jgi:hypothetical protein